MMWLLGMLVALLGVAVGVGYYRGWFGEESHDAGLTESSTTNDHEDS
jgi:hypothetical protein